jgi:hypothetical protein
MALDRAPRLIFRVSWREEELWELGTYSLTSQGLWDRSNPTHFAYLLVCRNNCKSEQNGGKGVVAVLKKWVLAAYQFWWVVQSTMTAKWQNSGRVVRCVIETKMNLIYMKK